MSNKDLKKQSVDVTSLSSKDKFSQAFKKETVSESEKKLIDEYYYIIETMASVIFSKKKLPPTVDYNDLISIGFNGLVKAIRGFNKEKNAQFKTYANIRVRGEMLDLIRKEWRSKANHQHNQMMDDIQSRVSQVLDNELNKGGEKTSVKNLLSSLTTSYVVSLEMVMDKYGDNVMDSSDSIESKFAENDEYSSLNMIIENLVKEDRDFIDMFYRKGFSQREIALELNISEATVSRKHVKIIEGLKETIRNAEKFE